MHRAEQIRRRCSVMTIPGALIVERGGRPVAMLSDPLLQDMFWFRWKITPLVADAAVTSGDFWKDSEIGNTLFRCKQSHAVADTAFWAGSNPVRAAVDLFFVVPTSRSRSRFGVSRFNG